MTHATVPTSAMVSILSRNNPAALAKIKQQFPDATFSEDLKLGDDGSLIDLSAFQIVAKEALAEAVELARRIRDFVRKRMLWHGRLSLTANLVGAGSAIGLVAAVANNLDEFELLAAGLAFAGSTVAVFSQHLEGRTSSGLSVGDALSKLATINRDIAVAQGSLKICAIAQRGVDEIEDVIRAANLVIAELTDLQINLGLPDK